MAARRLCGVHLAPRIALLSLLLGANAVVQAADTALSRIHGLIAPLRRSPPVPGVDARGPWHKQSDGTDWRGATPALTVARHVLREWIEIRLAATPENVRERQLVAELNSALARADLFCQRVEREDDPNPCSTGAWDWDPSGFVFPAIQIERPVRGVLVVQLGLGIQCGTDMSAYAYEWRAGHWQRFWQYEQPIAKGVDYIPQSLDAVRVSEPDPATGARHVLMLGSMDWCSSSFYPVYVQLWRARPDSGESRQLLNLRQPAWLGGDLEIEGGVSPTQAHFEFMRDDNITLESHEAMVNYVIHGDTLTRVDPLARNPAAFVLEWLDATWAESRRWAAPQDQARFEPEFRAVNSGDFYTEYPTTNSCRNASGSWQVTLDLSRHDEKPGYSLYLMVAQVSGERFEIRDIRKEPRADCDGPGFGAIEAAAN
jgi:hypothetical protein